MFAPSYQMTWFHRAICDEVQKWISGETKRLMIFVPPQHGKSQLVSRVLPAFILGKNPDARVAACSYGSEFASGFNRDVQRIIDSDKYREIFPETRLSGKGVRSLDNGKFIRNADSFEVVDKKGTYYAVGVGGPLTGRPVDYGIIDDPIKDRAEASSQVYRDRLWDWYTDVFSTRLHNNSRQLLMHTRWHEDDLAGRLLDRERKRWKVICYRSIKEQGDYDRYDKRNVGDVLWPDRHSKERILELKEKSERTFISLYQQRPAAQEGGLFLRKWWKFWDDLPAMDRILTSWDCTFKETGSSFVVGQVWGKAGANAYLIDQVRGKWDFPATVEQIRRLQNQYPMCREVLIEEKANGAAIISTLRNEISGIIPVTPHESKEARASAVSHAIEAGNVWLPSKRNAEWIEEAIEELSVFPNGLNDDIVDSLTQALYRIYGRSHARALKVAI
jgi:predicted phage terminase large subunit-like protein